MSHTAFQPPGPEFEQEADYVVVGSGAGGATAAVTLARGGMRVAIVEAGPWRDPSDYPQSVYGAMRDMLDAWGSNFTRGRAFWPIVQGALVGGSTVINSAIAVRTPGDIFEQWERECGVGGPAMAEAMWRIQDELERELFVEEVPEAALGRSNRLARQGADGIGYDSHYMLRYVKGCRGDGQCLQGCRSDKKQSLNRNFIPEVLSRRGAVVSCAPVDRILFDGRRHSPKSAAPRSSCAPRKACSSRRRSRAPPCSLHDRASKTGLSAKGSARTPAHPFSALTTSRST
jgi:choline dehydrogenase-like flavoprotein